MRLRLDPLIASTGAHAPIFALRRLLGRALEGLEVALCLHRVSQARRTDLRQPEYTIPAPELDALLRLLLASQPEGQRWLTVTFDDGYADAAGYLESRARQFPTVDWLFFICPEKTERGSGFRWDLESAGQAPLDLQGENQRSDLRRLAEDPRFALASVDTCRRLAALPNVTLGNHSNCHFRQVELTLEEAQTEYERSLRDFQHAFGPQRHFAFPFGTPDHDFDARHVALLRRRGRFLIWSTERRPFAPRERAPGAVLPRFPVNGAWNHRQIALWIAARALVYRARGTPHRFAGAVSVEDAA